MVPPVMNVFVPLMTYSFPSKVALVLIEETSLPASGSVMAAPVNALPCTKGGNHFIFCSSLPKRRTISEQKIPDKTKWATPGSTRQNSSLMRQCSRNPNPGPPYFSGMKTPTKPRLQAFSQRCFGDFSSRSHSWAKSGNSFSANPLAALIILLDPSDVLARARTASFSRPLWGNLGPYRYPDTRSDPLKGHLQGKGRMIFFSSYAVPHAIPVLRSPVGRTGDGCAMRFSTHQAPKDQSK